MMVCLHVGLSSLSAQEGWVQGWDYALSVFPVGTTAPAWLIVGLDNDQEGKGVEEELKSNLSDSPK